MAIGDTTSIVGRKQLGGPAGRSKQTVKRLAMQRARAVRDKDGNILYQARQSKTAQLDGRIAPNRKWFANTRTVTQKELDTMREVMQRPLAGNQVLVKDRRLPSDLIADLEQKKLNPVELQSFAATFGPKAQRKRPYDVAESASELLAAAKEDLEKYKEENDGATLQARQEREERRGTPADARLSRGATHRVHSEVYKVIDSADVICYVLDARDPVGTRSAYVERYLTLPENQHRHLVYILNKVDLVPTWATRSWVQFLQKEHPVIAYQASARRPYGRAELIAVLRQFSRLHANRPNISVAFLGFPNVGKSSVINSLTGQEPCKVAPIPGETKVWQFVNLTKRIFLIDSPGVVFGTGNANPDQCDGEDWEGGYGTDAAQVLRGVIRVEYVEYPERLVPVLLKQVRPEHVSRTYGVGRFKDAEDLLELMARKLGRLLPGGEPDRRSVARRLVEDFVRGRLPHFVAAWDSGEAESYRERHRQAIIDAQNANKRESDAALINFVNTQRLEAAAQEFKFLNEDLTERERLMIKMQDEEEKKLQELAKEMKKYGISGEESSDDKIVQARQTLADTGAAFGIQDNSESEIRGFDSDDVSDALEALESDDYTVQNTQDGTKGIIQSRTSSKKGIMANQLAGLRHTGVKRATRLLKTRNAELLRAASSGLVDEADLRRVVRETKRKAKKQRQGGWTGGKTGVHFYDQKKKEGK